MVIRSWQLTGCKDNRHHRLSWIYWHVLVLKVANSPGVFVCPLWSARPVQNQYILQQTGVSGDDDFWIVLRRPIRIMVYMRICTTNKKWNEYFILWTHIKSQVECVYISHTVWFAIEEYLLTRQVYILSCNHLIFNLLLFSICTTTYETFKHS